MGKFVCLDCGHIHKCEEDKKEKATKDVKRPYPEVKPPYVGETHLQPGWSTTSTYSQRVGDMGGTNPEANGHFPRPSTQYPRDY